MYFQSVNRNKRFIALNLKDSPEDRRIFEALLETADVLMENYRAGVLDRLGYPWEVLHKRFPRMLLNTFAYLGFRYQQHVPVVLHSLNNAAVRLRILAALLETHGELSPRAF